MKRKELLIIIPAYNEESTIGSLLEQLDQPEIKGIADVLIMNDHSIDKTNVVAKRSNRELVSHVYNLGYGGGLRLGYKFAVRRGYKYIIQMDADGQHDTCNIPTIYEHLKTPDENGKLPDIVLGSRLVEGSSYYPLSHAKRLAFCLFRTMIKLRTGRKIMDPTTGLQGMSRKAFLFYSQFGMYDDRYPDANMIMQMLILGFNIKEVPAVMHLRKTGNSMHSGLEPVGYMIRMFFSVIAIVFRIDVLNWGKDYARSILEE